jgi:predicted PurR-regulated permease PerM
MLAVVTVILCAWALRVTMPVSLPLAFALLAKAAVWPLKQRLERWMPPWASLTLSAAALLVTIALFALALYLSAAEVLAQLQSSSGVLNEMHRQLADFAARHGIVLDDQFGAATNLLRRAALDGYRVAVFVAFVVILVIFGLPEVSRIRGKLQDWLSRKERSEIAETAEEIADQVRRYLGVTLALSLVTGIACWLWGWAVGLQLAVTWGLLNFLLNFVPIAGNIIGIVPPTLYAFGQFGSGTRALVVFAGFAAIQLIISNFLNPWLQGRALSLSPFVILVAIAFWGWLWGIGGALLAVPMTSAAVLVCNGFEKSRWIALMIAREPGQKGAG